MEGKKARKTDRRIEKTKQAMRHAFVELLKKKALQCNHNLRIDT